MITGSNIGAIIGDDSHIRRFCANHDNMNIGFFNAQSLNPCNNSSKLDEVKHLLRDRSLDIVGVAETWFKSYVSNRTVSIPGYKIYRSDRVNMRGGGVALYISDSYKSRIIHKVSEPGVCEALFVQVNSSTFSFVVGVVYLPRGNLNAAEPHISDITSRFNDVVLVGDFNCDILNSHNYHCLRDMLIRCNLHVLHNNIPTHFDLRANSNSLIDYTLVSNKSVISRSNQFYFPPLNSYHAFLLVQCTFHSVNDPRVIHYRDYNAINCDNLFRDINDTDFSLLYNTNDTDAQLAYFNHNIQHLHNQHVPEKTRITYPNETRWINHPDVLVAARNKELALRAYLENKTDSNKFIFKKYSANARRVLRRVKRAHGLLMFSGISNSVDFWRRVNGTGLNTCDGDTCDINLNHLNTYFTSNTTNTPAFFNIPSVDTRDNCLNFRCFDDFDLLSAINRIKSNALGTDAIPIRFLKLILPSVKQHILHILNTIVTTCHFPSDWKVALVMPVKKKDTPGINCSDFRPISILPALSKILEMLIKDQISYYLEENAFLSQYQSGFRGHHSTTTLMIHMTDKIRRSIDHKHPGVLAVLDLSKAFDSIDHAILCEKLFSQYLFSNTSCKLIQSFLFQRSQYVISRGNRSDLCYLSSGVPQGSILGPILFMMYINDISHCVHFSSFSIYADDIQLFSASASNDINECIRNLDSDIGRICLWVTQNKININIRKTKCILFQGLRSHISDNSIVVQNTTIAPSSPVSCLGFLLDSDLKFTSHISHVCSKLNMVLRKLYNLNVVLPINVKYTLAHAVLMPHILYGVEVYIGSNLSSLVHLSTYFHKILRYVYGSRCRHDYEPYEFEFLGCSFERFLQVRCLYLFFCIIKFNKPEYLCNSFSFLNSTRNTQLRIDHFTGSIYARSFSIRAARLWNSLPANLKNFSVSPCNFKHKLMMYYANMI